MGHIEEMHVHLEVYEWLYASPLQLMIIHIHIHIGSKLLLLPCGMGEPPNSLKTSKPMYIPLILMANCRQVQRIKLLQVNYHCDCM